jgi:hypothetical protein
MGRISRLERLLSRGGGGRKQPQHRNSPTLAGTYRTLCVRLCDGYYFPLNFATNHKGIAADEKKCASQYGPGEAALFYHRTGSDPSEAISTKGKRYSALNQAFAYRSLYRPQCAAQLPAGLAALRQRVFDRLAKSEATASDKAAIVVPIPSPRPHRFDDPETAANKAGDFVPEPIEPPVAAARMVGTPYPLDAAVGPPPTIPDYTPPVLRDFREAIQASMFRLHEEGTSPGNRRSRPTSRASLE